MLTNLWENLKKNQILTLKLKNMFDLKDQKPKFGQILTLKKN